MIERFRIQNFKALRNVELRLTPIHTLIGPNDSGKTSILEALAALSRSVDRHLHEAFEGAWKGRELVFQSMDLPVKFEADFGSGERYSLAVQFGILDRTARVHEEILNGTPFRSRFGGPVTNVCGVLKHGDQVPDPILVQYQKYLRSACQRTHVPVDTALARTPHALPNHHVVSE